MSAQSRAFEQYLDAYSAAQFEHGYESSRYGSRFSSSPISAAGLNGRNCVRSLDAHDVIDFFDVANGNSEYVEAIRRR